MASINVTAPMSVKIKAAAPMSAPVQLPSAANTVLMVPTPGPPGVPGEDGLDGSGFSGTAWWYGAGTPEGVVGSKVGDYYLDTTTGVVYRLGD